MDERLIHYSTEPLTCVHSCQQLPSGGRESAYWKPRGLWVSVEGENDWKQWCESEQFSLDRFAHATQIILAPTANILRLTTPQELRDFSREHGFNPYPDLPIHLRCMHGIQWWSIAAKHQGIIIAPYLYQCRLDDDVFWYYSWDCASGCIWDATAVAELKVLDHAQRTTSADRHE